MRTLKNLVLASAAAGALALGGAAFAKDAPQTHVMTLALPDGGVATIHYQGARPQVTITPGALMPAWEPDPLSERLWHWSFADPLLKSSDIFADMDRQMASMAREMRALDAAPNANLIAASPGGRYCAETMEMTQTPGRPAHVERHVYGDCAAQTGEPRAGAANTTRSTSGPPAHDALHT